MDMLVIDQTQNGSAVETSVGDSFQLKLAENPTTGYRWQLLTDVAPALRLVQEFIRSIGERARRCRGTVLEFRRRPSRLDRAQVGASA